MNNKIKKIILSKINKIYTFSNLKNSLDEAAKELSKEILILEYNPEKSDKLNIEDGFKLRQLCSLFNALLIVKNRLDIAKIIKADRIILNKDSIQPKFFNDFFDENNYVGYEILSQNEIKDIELENLDFIKLNSSLIYQELFNSDIKIFI